MIAEVDERVHAGSGGFHFIRFPSDGGSHVLGREHGEVMCQLREVWFFVLPSFIVGS